MFVVTAIDDYHAGVRFVFQEYDPAFWLLEKLRDFGFSTSLHEDTGWPDRSMDETNRGSALLLLLDSDLTYRPE